MLNRFHTKYIISLSVCLCVCVSPFHVVVFEAYFAPISRSWMSKVLEIRNPWGKVLERSGLRIEHFCYKMVLNRPVIFFFFSLLILPYKTWWKPRFPMD